MNWAQGHGARTWLSGVRARGPGRGARASVTAGQAPASCVCVCVLPARLQPLADCASLGPSLPQGELPDFALHSPKRGRPLSRDLDSSVDHEEASRFLQPGARSRMRRLLCVVCARQHLPECAATDCKHVRWLHGWMQPGVGGALRPTAVLGRMQVLRHMSRPCVSPFCKSRPATLQPAGCQHTALVLVCFSSADDGAWSSPAHNDLHLSRCPRRAGVAAKKPQEKRPRMSM